MNSNFPFFCASPKELLNLNSGILSIGTWYISVTNRFFIVFYKNVSIKSVKTDLKKSIKTVKTIKSIKTVIVQRYFAQK